MAVRANTMIYEAASPALSDILIEMLNRRVTPVVQSRGSLGEADLAAMANVLGAMGGAGDGYYQGRRMSAAAALAAAGLKPLQPTDVVYPSALISTNAYSVGQGALLVHDAKLALDWADLILAIDLEAMNSSVTPLTTPVQANRPFKYLNLEAARVLDMIKGSYLFDADPKRIIQDPESQRASFSRQGAAWKAWSTLRDTMLTQLNSSDHNPAVKVQAAPEDSWELDTPQMRKYFVKGGPESHGQHGFVLSNANWDPYPMANEVEALTTALANMDVAVVQRIYRFSSTFFTVIAPKDALTPEQLEASVHSDIDGYNPTAIWHDIKSLAPTLTPEGNPISNDVEELQAQTVLKVTRARQIVDDTLLLLGEDLLTATFWMDVRRAQSPDRNFGRAPTAAWTAFRQAVPWQQKPQTRPAQPVGDIVHAFLTTRPAADFYPPLAKEIDGDK
jgi:histidine ammonia-lyase